MRIILIFTIVASSLIGCGGVSSDDPILIPEIDLHKNYLVITNFSEEWLKRFAANNEFNPVEDWIKLGSASTPGVLHNDVRIAEEIDYYWRIALFSGGSKDGWKLLYLDPDQTKIVIAWDRE